METDHIKPKGEGGSDDIDNAIPVCFDCHAEIHLYNPAHPRGRKYTEEELRMHRDQWLAAAGSSAAFLASVPADQDAGPLQGLVDELEYNQIVLARQATEQVGAPLSNERFRAAIASGAISLIDEKVKALIYEAYATMERANAFIAATPSFQKGTDAWAHVVNEATASIKQAQRQVATVLNTLRQHLGHER
jgi:hypothetical protein